MASSGRARRCSKCSTSRARSRGTTPTCWWWARPERAKNSSPAPFTSSARSAPQRLAVCNCSALVDTLLESQLFGHVRGAFTGATDTRPGLFEYANGGTVFLDEVGETSLAMQAKLLRVIQNREIQRVGSPEVKQINVHLIAATNRDLRAEVLAGRFREDLFYRLSSIQIRIPPLSERLEDIPLLVQFFLKEIQRGLRQENSRLDPPRPGRAAAAPLAGERPRTRKRDLQRVHHGRPATSSTSATSPNTCSTAAATRRIGRRVAPALARRGPQDSHPARARHVPGKSFARRAHPRHRPHQSLPLSKTRWR